MRIRSRLFVLVVAVLLPTAIGAAFATSYVYREQQNAYRASIQEFSRAMAIVLDKEIFERETLLKSLAASPALEKGDLKSFYRHADRLALGWETTIVLSNLDGQQLLNTRVPLGTKELPKTNTSMMALRKEHGADATVVSNIYFAPIGRSHSFAVQIPVRINGELKYHLSIGSFAKQLQTVFADEKLPDGWVGTILDQTGTVVARSSQADEFVGKKVSPGLLAKFLASPEGFHDGTSLTGIPVTAFFNRAPKTNWGFLIAVPREQMQQTAVRATALMATVFLSALALAIALAVLVGRRIAKPMESLRAAAAKMGQGEPFTGSRFGIAEMDAVNSELVRASAQIRGVRSELETRVADAVASAKQSQQALLQSQKLEALGRLTGGIAHDFNNVLQTLTTGLQVINLTSEEPRTKTASGSCQRAVQRASELVRQLMSFGRVQDANLASVDLSSQIKEITPMLMSGLRSDINLVVNVEPGIWPVTIDSLQFELAMLNLAINARDAMPTGGTVTITASNRMLSEPPDGLSPGEYIQIMVTDSGAGMSEHVLTHAVDPFFTTKKIGRGSGMGLPQVYGFVKQAGGALTLDSKVGVGTMVNLYLPKEDQPPLPTETKEASKTPRFMLGRVLLVEDDPLVANVVQPALENTGLDVQVASSGDDALAILSSGAKFDVVFSDIVMPGATSGIDLAQRLQEEHPDIGIVLVTGYSEKRVSLSGVRILPKPYDIAEVVQALHQELHKKSSMRIKAKG